MHILHILQIFFHDFKGNYRTIIKEALNDVAFIRIQPYVHIRFYKNLLENIEKFLIEQIQMNMLQVILKPLKKIMRILWMNYKHISMIWTTENQN